MSAIRDTSLLHQGFRERLEALLEELRGDGFFFRIFETWRTAKRQAQLYGQGRPKDPLYSEGRIVTYALPWSSFHQFGLAADLVIDVKGVNPWSIQKPYHHWWEVMHAVARRRGLQPLSFELAHVQLDGVTMQDLRQGIYPPGGGDLWALQLSRTIDEYPKGAPPKPKET